MSLKIKQILKPSHNPTLDQNEIILNLLNEGICRLDIGGNITYANRSALGMLNRNETEIVGKHYSEAFYASENEGFVQDNDFCPIDFVLIEGETSHVNADHFYKSDGESKFSVEYMCVPVRVDDEITGAVISFQDVTERRDIEIEISKARDEALEAAKAKAAFLANMSHEIRTPLSGIVGTADLLLDSKLNEKQQKYAEMLKKSTDLLSHIVDDILDFSKIEAGKFEREQIELNVHQIAADTIDLFESLIQHKDISLRLEVDSSVPEKLLGDAQSIRQILNNFVSNAIKFTEAGNVLLKITKVKNSPNKTKLRFSVSDHGIGIDRESQEQLFQPFTQADFSITRKFGGTGLGLAICRQLVDLMGGGIGVESKLGEGSTFWFECDFEINKNDRNELLKNVIFSNIEDKIVEKQFVDRNKEFKLLIVEDNPTNREITSAMFKQLGLDSTTAENGLEAVKACMEEEFDLILMDCHMPEMDGFEAAKLIRKKENVTNNPKIIAFTASITKTERDRCFSVGMDDYLSKPFTKQDLSDVLEKHFQIHNLPSNLDLEENMIHHSLSNLIEPKMLAGLLEIESNDQKGFVFEILDIFLEHAEKKIAETDSAIIAKNRVVIKNNAHNLKGSGGNVGLTEISKLFEDLETKSKEADWNEIESFFEKTKRVFEETKQKILERKP